MVFADEHAARGRVVRQVRVSSVAAEPCLGRSCGPGLWQRCKSWVVPDELFEPDVGPEWIDGLWIRECAPSFDRSALREAE